VVLNYFILLLHFGYRPLYLGFAIPTIIDKNLELERYCVSLQKQFIDYFWRNTVGESV
jgi:hypothetical protein